MVEIILALQCVAATNITIVRLDYSTDAMAHRPRNAENYDKAR